MRVLIPLPNRDFDVTEVAVPGRILGDAGHQVVFATERPGVRPAADPRLLAGVLFGRLGAADQAKDFYQELSESPEFTSTAGWAQLDVAGFAGLLRVKRRPAMTISPVPAAERAQVHSGHRVQHHEHQVVPGQPLAHVHRQQQRLITLREKEILRHKP